MARLNASQVAAKWNRGMTGAAESMKAGVQSVTTSPTAQAAAAVDRYAAGVRKAIDDGTYVQNLQKVTLQDWQKAMVEKGIPNLQNGIKAGTQRMQAFMQDFLPYAESVSQDIAQMPKGTLQDSINRSTAAITKLAQYKFRG